MGGRFSQDVIETVRSAGDIVGLVSDYVPLKKAGSRHKGLCPFHDEKTPSFSVDPDRQLFYCFGCQTGGDIFKFVQLYEQVPFPEAVELLAHRWGVKLPSESGQTATDPKARLHRMNRVAAEFFRAVLLDDEGGRVCRDYLASRGIDDEVAERVGIGFAPDAWEALHNHLKAKGFSAKEMLDGGLVLPRKSGSGHYDRFRNRLMFPIRDVSGNVVAFGGRALGDTQPKYINSPETPAYVKSDHLYGLDLARAAVRREGFAIIVEGYLDLVALLSAGLDNVVASLGTAFTPSQVRLISRYTERVVVSYDGDAAGAAATRRSLDLLLAKGLAPRVVALPVGLDPDDCIRQEGAEAYVRLMRQAPEYLQFLIDQEARTRDLSQVREQVAAVNAVLPHLAKLSNSIERTSWATRLADTLQIEEETVMQELRTAIRAARPGIRQKPEGPPVLRDAEARLVNLLLRSDDERRRCADAIAEEDLAGSSVATIVKKILELSRESDRVDCPQVLAALETDAERELLTQIAFRDEPEAGPGVEDCLEAFKRRRLKREGREALRQVGQSLNNSGDAADGAVIDRQLQRLQELAKQRDRLA